jgi:hypothetical protein
MRQVFEATREGGISDSERLGSDAGAELKSRAGTGFFAVG